MISHKHKCIFIHIPKCGGISIENMFLEDLGLGWKDRIVLTMGKNTNPRIDIPRLAHLSLDQMISGFYLNDLLIHTYYKFAVVRSPYSRIKSFYNYLGYSNLFSFKKFVCEILPEELSLNSNGMAWFFKPQSEYLYYNGEFCVDKVIHLETISEEIEFIISKFNLTSRLEHKNASGSLPFEKKSIQFLSNLRKHGKDIEIFSSSIQNFDDEMISIVKDYYLVDFQHFKIYDV